MFCLFFALAVPPAAAETPDILRRLQQEPLTLFDWGMANLDRDLQQAVQRLGEEDFATTPPKSSTTFFWRDGRIRLAASFFAPSEERTTAACIERFQRLVSVLVESAPRGPEAASWYLATAFQPSSHYWGSRLEDTGAGLLKTVLLRVSLRAPSYDKLAGDSRKIDCSGPLNATADTLAFDASS